MTGSDAYNNEPWVDDDTPALRPYALTQGRTRPTQELSLASLVRASTNASADLSPEHDQALDLCRVGPRSVAEVAATLRLPVQVTKVLLADLIDSHTLILSMPARAADPADPLILEALLVGLRQL
ncbi:DUF742 domain-containing protein [Streptomyces sp. B1866]|uniref:DUF742 domain-containing protein n=1 Tax=Streptomyces sp. B1866 TaxID=3075431 RepID=UPI0028902A7F|nr:DUF742 domain-containing protein [Streptomyces sp. B1866]MDT3397713.1 DUF742 domain-containing protein [Streptomyces sp. B1866]